MKHQITEEDILSVPEFSLEIFTTEECIALRKMCMNLLNLSRLQNDCNEVGLFLDGWCYSSYKWFRGTENNVRLELDWGGLVKDCATAHTNRYIFIHNHPTDSGFSMRDIQSFLKNKYLGCIIVVRATGGLDFLYKLTNVDPEMSDWFVAHFDNKQDFYEVCEMSGVYHKMKRRKRHE